MRNDQLTQFFTDVGKDELLLFTTFTLDEAVLRGLLEHFAVAKRQRIIVFHDVLRHRNPGILKAHYPNAMVYSVALAQRHPQRCPVFHSKLWARMTGPTITDLVITSANLSQYHLVEQGEGGTFESLQLLSSLQLDTRTTGWLFSEALLYPSPAAAKQGLLRITEDPYSLVVDTRNSPALFATDVPLIEQLRPLGVPRWCAAPFICESAVQQQLQPHHRFKVYQGHSPHPHLALHAKAMAFPQAVALGSVNWTTQAMGCLGITINHETLLLAPADPRLQRALKPFPQHSLGNQDQDYPGDPDMDEPLEGDWLAERQLRLDAPEQALFTLDKSGAHIRLVGPFKAATWVRLQSDNTDAAVTLALQHNLISEPASPDERGYFAQIIASGQAMLSGLDSPNGPTLWRLQLNYQHYWPTFADSRMSAASNGVGLNVRDAKQARAMHFQDVRDVRRQAMQQPEQARQWVLFNDWLFQRGIRQTRLPHWCVALAEYVAKGASA